MPGAYELNTGQFSSDFDILARFKSKKLVCVCMYL